MPEQDTGKKSEPAPPPVVRAPPQVAPKAQAPAVTAQHWGFDPLRPLRYAAAFVGGTVMGTLDAAARGGRRGFYIGISIALLMWFTGGVSVIAAQLGFLQPYLGQAAGNLVGSLMTGAISGLLGGATLGAVAGVLTGGYKGVTRAYRKEKYADDLAVRMESQASRHRPRVNYRDCLADHERSADYNFDRLLQQERRNDSWVERISAQDRGASRGF